MPNLRLSYKTSRIQPMFTSITEYPGVQQGTYDASFPGVNRSYSGDMPTLNGIFVAGQGCAIVKPFEELC